LCLAKGEIGVLEAFLKRAHLGLPARVNPIAKAIIFRLASETVNDRIHGIGLVRLDLEFKLHGESAFLNSFLAFLRLS
jgi:hypothetical protein